MNVVINHSILILVFNLIILIDEATKLIAATRQHETVVRDANGIHRFYKNGQCSCNDYF